MQMWDVGCEMHRLIVRFIIPHLISHIYHLELEHNLNDTYY